MIYLVVACVSSAFFVCSLMEINFFNFVVGTFKYIKTAGISLSMYVLGLGLSYFRKKTQLKSIDNKWHEITFYDGSHNFAIRFPIQRGPRWYEKVSLENGEDVTEKIYKYAGPSHNFYGIQTTPEMLGYSSLIFYLRNGDNKFFKSKDVIEKF